MNKTFIIFNVLLLLSGLLYGQNAEEKKLNQRRQWHQSVNTNIDQLRKVELPPEKPLLLCRRSTKVDRHTAAARWKSESAICKTRINDSERR